MSTAFDDGVPRMRRFGLEWLGHYWIQLLIGYDIATAPLMWLGDGWLVQVVNCAVVVPGILLFLYGMGHEVKLCGPCAAKIPLDGQGGAVKHRRTLRAVHWLSASVGGRHLAASRGLLLLFVLFGAGFVLPSGPWWQLGSTVAGGTYFYSLILMWRIHQRLAPWCPQCRWGDGGEEESSPDPAPSHGLVPAGGAS